MGRKFDASGLGAEWDQIEQVRSNLRAKEPLLKHQNKKNKGADATIVECTANSEILIPALHRLNLSQRKLPDITSLRDEVEIVYSKSSREVGQDQIDDDAWDIRKMLRFVKRKCGRNDPSLDACSVLIISCIFQQIRLSKLILIFSGFVFHPN